MLRAKWTPDLSLLCSMCELKDETFLHVFWECEHIQPLWAKLIQMCQDKVSDQVVYNCENCLLKGFDIPLLNVLMTFCKYHIHLLRMFPNDFSFDALVKQITSFRRADITAYQCLPYLKAGKMFALW